jgi:thioredoxin reductase (NADPH)
MNDIFDIIIIGGGPAGLTAGIYSGRAGYDTLLIEKVGLGGQVMLTDIIENYPGFPDGITGFELQERMSKQMDKFGVKKTFENVIKIEKNEKTFMVKTDLKEYKALSVIIASGADHKKLNIPGEKEFISKGVSYCGTCDAPFFKNKNVIVVGGGDTALSEALFLSKFANQVTIIHRRDRFRAVKDLVNKAENTKNIDFLFNTMVIKINGENMVTSVTLKDIKSDKIYEKNINGVFIFIGNVPNNNFIDKNLLDDNGYIIADQFMSTKQNGIFVAGDIISNTFRQIICAASDGAKASEYAGKYVDALKGNSY